MPALTATMALMFGLLFFAVVAVIQHLDLDRAYRRIRRLRAELESAKVNNAKRDAKGRFVKAG